jgi:hypothetical protein
MLDDWSEPNSDLQTPGWNSPNADLETPDWGV